MNGVQRQNMGCQVNAKISYHINEFFPSRKYYYFIYVWRFNAVYIGCPFIGTKCQHTPYIKMDEVMQNTNKSKIQLNV